LSEGDKQTHKLAATLPLQLFNQVFLEGHHGCDRSLSGIGARKKR
jgi:hypothetical protein